MTDDREDAGFDLAMIRERATDDPVDDAALGALEGIADEAGVVRIGAFEAWHDECAGEIETAAGRLDAFESWLDDRWESLDAFDRELDHVWGRFDGYEAMLDDLRGELSDAEVRLDEVDRSPATAAGLYEGARDLRACAEGTHHVAHRLEHVEEEFDWFGSWLAEPARRLGGFDAELDALEGYLGRIERILDGAERHAGDPPPGFRPFDAWAGAAHLHRLADVALAELRVELAELDRWLDRQHGNGRAHEADLSALAARLDALADRHRAIDDGLDASADAIEGFEESYDGIAGALERFDRRARSLGTPVDWEAANRLLREQFDELDIPYA